MLRKLSLLMWIGVVFLTLGCEIVGQESVALSGWLVDSYGSEVPVGEAEVQVSSRDGSEVLGTATTAVDGAFTVMELPPTTPVALAMGKTASHSWSVFTGLTESVDLTLFMGAVYSEPLEKSLENIEEYRSAEGAPAVLADYTIDFDQEDNGGMLSGRVGEWISGEFGLYFDNRSGAQVEVITGETSHAVCYRAQPEEGAEEDEGVADCQATATSPDSRFAAFGLPAGPVTIKVTGADETVVEENTLVVEDGVTYLMFYALAYP